MQWFERKFTFGVSPEMLPYYLERLEGTIVRIENKVKGLDEAFLSFKPDGKWSIKQHIGHLAEVDAIALQRIDEMRSGISPMSPAVFEPRGDYNNMTIEEVIKVFANSRIANLRKYESLTAEELTCSSLHPRLKLQMNAVDLAYFDAEHDDHHLVKVTEIIKQYS